MTSVTDAITAWSGLEIVDKGGHFLGRCSQTYTDADSGAPEWLLVTASNGSQHIAPVGGARRDGDRVRLGFSGSVVLSSPAFSATQVLTPEDEVRLYGHYDLALPSAAVLREAAETAARRTSPGLPARVGAVVRRPAPLGGGVAVLLAVVAAVYVFRRARRRP